jgi:hypothetical protein
MFVLLSNLVYFRRQLNFASTFLFVPSSDAVTKSSVRDRDVKRLGVLTVPMPDIAGGYSRLIKINIHFGYTELFVTASEEGTNRKVEAKFNWGFHLMIRIPRCSPRYQTPYLEHTIPQNCFFQLLEVRPIVR